MNGGDDGSEPPTMAQVAESFAIAESADVTIRTTSAQATITGWAQALTNRRLAADLLALSANVRHYNPVQREAVLREASRRLREGLFGP